MIPTLKAEFRKLLSVRSTYYMLGFVLLIAVFFAFYASGWKLDKTDLLNPNTLSGDVTSAISVVSIIVALIAVLLMSHEYRYNTIMYTLTSSNSRGKVLLAKILAVSCFSVVFTLCIGALSPLLSLLGIHAHHLKLVPQTIHYGSLVWQSLFYGWGYAMAGLVIATLVRNLVGAIVTLLIVPGTVESLLGLLLKKNTVYLPFTALDKVIGQGMNYNKAITPLHAALVFSGYLIVAWAVAWTLFLRRDAN
jgi:ABC-type transport system involved in multi-copper enzyme maturation permease subunit